VSQDEIERAVAVPVLASVPRLKAKERGDGVIPIVDYLRSKPISRFSEAVRTLRRTLERGDGMLESKIIQVTAAALGDGTTTIAASLAQSATSIHPRVLLVDANIRDPALTGAFGLSDRSGLVDVISGAKSVQETVVRNGEAGLDVLGVGSDVSKLPDLLASGGMQLAIEQLRQSYDLVVLDSPPVGPVVDAVEISRYADKIVFVIAWNSTPRELVVDALRQLDASSNVAGMALNRVALTSSSRLGLGHHSRGDEKFYAD
jgi:capsular exopolysaccharide synthesis family protein